MPFSIGIIAELTESLDMIDCSELEVYDIPETSRIFVRLKGTEIYILVMGLYYTTLKEAEIIHTINLEVI